MAVLGTIQVLLRDMLWSAAKYPVKEYPHLTLVNIHCFDKHIKHFSTCVIPGTCVFLLQSTESEWCWLLHQKAIYMTHLINFHMDQSSWGPHSQAPHSCIVLLSNNLAQCHTLPQFEPPLAYMTSQSLQVSPFPSCRVELPLPPYALPPDASPAIDPPLDFAAKLMQLSFAAYALEMGYNLWLAMNCCQSTESSSATD